MRILHLIPRLAVVLAFVAAPAFADDWPQWRGKNRNGTSAEEIRWPSSGPRQLWKANVGVGYSSVSVSRGRAYTMGNVDGQEFVWCLDARSGEVIWKYEVPVPRTTGPLIKSPKTPGGFQDPYRGPNSTPVVDGKLVYAVSRDGLLLALDAAKGTSVWSADYAKDFGGKKQPWGHASSPLVDGDLLFAHVGVEGASVVAFEKATGKVVWKSGYDAIGFASPLSWKQGKQHMIVMFSANGLFAYNRADGKLLWNAEWASHHEGNAMDPVISGDSIFISSDYGVGCCLLKVADNEATEVYRRKTFGSHFPNPVLVENMLYGVSGHINSKPKLICLDLKTGDIKWEVKEGGTGVIAAGNTLLVQTPKGMLIAVKATPEAYTEIGSVQALDGGVCWTPPSLADGRVYCRNAEGIVVCLDLSGKANRGEPASRPATPPATQATTKPAAPAATTPDTRGHEVSAAVEQAMRLPAGKDRDKALDAAALEWLQQEPTAALAWALELPASFNHTRLYVTSQCGEKHGKRVADWLLANKPKAFGSLHFVMHYWAHADPEPALEWCTKAPDEVRHLLFCSLGDGWTYRDPAGATAGFAKVTALADRRSMAYGICKAWTWSHPENAVGATTWALGLKSQEERRSALYGIGMGWSRYYLPSTTAWIKTLKNKDEIRAAAYGVVKCIQAGLVEKQEGPERVRNVGLYDKGYAKEWLKQFGLSDAEQTAILDGPAITMKDPGKIAWPE